MNGFVMKRRWASACTSDWRLIKNDLWGSFARVCLTVISMLNRKTLYCGLLLFILLQVNGDKASAQCAIEKTDGECAGSGFGNTYWVANKSQDHMLKCSTTIKKNGAFHETDVRLIAAGDRKILRCSKGGLNSTDIFTFEISGSDQR